MVYAAAQPHTVAPLRSPLPAGVPYTREQIARLLPLLTPAERAELDALLGVNDGIFTQYQTDPLGYAKDILHITLTEDQKAILLSIRDNRRTCVKASHDIGKTFVAAVAACWWYDCWPQHIVYVTAPTWDQAVGLTFKEITRIRRANGRTGQILSTGMIRDTMIARQPGHFIRAINAERGEGFQGEHTADILIIMEEATGVPSYIWGASDGLMTAPGCRTLAIGNPTDEATAFGEAAASVEYHTLTISALNHSNVIAALKTDPPPYPRAVSLLWVAEMLRKECQIVDTATADTFTWLAPYEIDRALHGVPADLTNTVLYKPSADFQGRVLGQFPGAPAEQVIPRAWVEACPVLPAVGTMQIGCDVARYGPDRTVIAVRCGPCALDLQELRHLDNLVVAGALKDAADYWGPRYGMEPRRIPILIDTTGGLGTGPYDLLRAWGYDAHAINSSETALDPDTFPNRRSELWWATRLSAYEHRLDFSRLAPDIRERLIKELTGPKWKPDAKSRKVVESKDVMKLRTKHSPDLADAWNLAQAGFKTVGAPVATGNTRDSLVSDLPYRPISDRLPVPAYRPLTAGAAIGQGAATLPNPFGHNARGMRR